MPSRQVAGRLWTGRLRSRTRWPLRAFNCHVSYTSLSAGQVPGPVWTGKKETALCEEVCSDYLLLHASTFHVVPTTDSLLFPTFSSLRRPVKPAAQTTIRLETHQPIQRQSREARHFLFSSPAYLLYPFQEQEAQTSCKFSCAWAGKYCFPCTSCNLAGKSCQTGEHLFLSFHLNCFSTRLATD